MSDYKFKTVQAYFRNLEFKLSLMVLLPLLLVGYIFLRDHRYGEFQSIYEVPKDLISIINALCFFGIVVGYIIRRRYIRAHKANSLVEILEVYHAGQMRLFIPLALNMWLSSIMFLISGEQTVVIGFFISLFASSYFWPNASRIIQIFKPNTEIKEVLRKKGIIA